ncbi:sugar transferase [Roseovarius atlanticus]|uniref:Sugar transferase n=1 Tax=Roseovarius atlanticus TaxID=1641875 RepID=A0A0T5NZR9_9RHOB|nr:sugar transferase [Roseovarius atlanticus]KRS14370.1 sugar transferase [Roseovarius atlanticus]
MTPGKRLMDIVLALVLAAVLCVPTAIVALIVLVRDGRPILYPSKRMKAPGQSFTLWKFRTMATADRDASVSGAYKQSRITATGRVLRRTRLDELPQLWNILRGDMSFVGPRPPLPRFVRLCPEIYAEVLKNRPGVTGLATLVFHKREERLLAQCHTQSETDAVYLRRCVPAKAKIDLIWARNRTVCFDLILILATVRRVFAFRG